MKNASPSIAHWRRSAANTQRTNPIFSWQLLAQAERWEHLAAEAISDHFNECNLSKSGNASGENDMLRTTVVAAA